MPFRGAAKRGLITSVTSRVPSGSTTASTSKLSMTVCDAAGTGAATRRAASKGANPSTLRRARRSRIPGLIGPASPALLSGGAEADLGHFTLGGHGHFEEFARLEVEHPGEDVRGELRDFGVEVAHDGVVIAPRVLECVFDLGERALELREAFHGAKLRVSLGQGKQVLERAGEHAFGLALGSRALRGHGAVARVDDSLERALLVSGVALDRFHHVGDQVVAALELHINVGPGVIALHLETHQAVVHADGKQQHNRDDNQKNQHRTSLGRLKWLRSFRRSLYALALHPVKRDAARPHGGPGQYPLGTLGRRNPHTKLRLEKWPSVQRRQRRVLSGKARAISLRAG